MSANAVREIAERFAKPYADLSLPAPVADDFEAAIHEALREPLEALAAIANDPHNSYANTEGGSYGTGVTDGHRCAAAKARPALAKWSKKP